MARVNYLNNRDMLAEIHKSKKTFCYFTKPEYSDYDIILATKEDIPSNIEEAIANRTKRLGSPAKVADLVFRIVMWDHIPEAPAKPKKVKGKKNKVEVDYFAEETDDIIIEEELDEPILDNPVAVKYVKLNFPPFVHYHILPSGELELIGKSHWKGDLETGAFCRDHGKVTNKLAMMWLKICDRYATKSNYRGYSFVDEMRGQGILQLSMVGLQFDESKSLNPFAFYTQCVTNSFTRVLNHEKKMRDIRDDLLEIASLNPSFTRQNSNDSGGEE